MCLPSRVIPVAIETIAPSTKSSPCRWITLHWGIYLCPLAPECYQFVTVNYIKDFTLKKENNFNVIATDQYVYVIKLKWIEHKVMNILKILDDQGRKSEEGYTQKGVLKMNFPPESG